MAAFWFIQFYYHRKREKKGIKQIKWGRGSARMDASKRVFFFGFTNEKTKREKVLLKKQKKMDKNFWAFSSSSR